MKFAAIMALVLSAASGQSPAPQPCASGATLYGVWDTSGNGLLNGTYNFRYVQYTVGDQSGDLSHAAALYGTIAFDGKGNYKIDGMDLDSNSIPLAATSSTVTGTYSISACGFGFITNPLSSADVVWGLVSQYGVFVGSSTETQNPFNDLFIGAPATPASTNAILKGSYSVGYMNFADGYVGDAVTAGFQMAPDGAGHIGSANILMYQASNSAPAYVIEPVNYSFASGIGTLTFPVYGQAISRQKSLYISPDANFIFGGGPDAFDLFVGVRTQTATTPTTGFPAGFAAAGFSGLYYQAGIDEIVSNPGSTPTGSLQTYYGALKATAGIVYDHQRIVAPLGSPLQGPLLTPLLPASFPYQPFNYTYVDPYSLAFGSNLGYADTATKRQYVFGANGALRLGFGVYPNLGISIALQAPAIPTSPGYPVYIYPTGILNAASYAPYTSGIAPGEMIVLYGSNLASAGNQTQVTINGESAPIVGAALPGQVTVIVPSDITGPSAQIQLTDGTASNIVWTFVNKTALGVLTQSQNGRGDAAAQDSSSKLVTISNPVIAGKPLSFDITGLGNLSTPPGIFGIAPPSSPTSSIAVTIGGVPATVTSITAAPGNAGVSVVTVTVPATGVVGDAPIVVYGPDSTTAQTTIEVSSGH